MFPHFRNFRCQHPVDMYLKVLLLAIFLTGIQHGIRLLQLLGYHRTVFEHSPGPCHTLEHVVGGSVDLEMLENGLVFIASGHVSGKTDKGRVYTFNLSHPDQPVTELTMHDDFNQSEFWPHGIAAWRDNDTNEVTLFVINHHTMGDRIEKFHFNEAESKLIHLDTIQDHLIKSANYLVATSADEFYLTNVAHTKTRGASMLEFVMMLAWGTLVHYDGSKAHLLSRLFIPNGLALSANHSLLYVSVAGSQEIRVFQRKKNNKLEYASAMRIEAHLAGITVDAATNTLWMAAANSAAESQVHDNHPTAHCGSRVFRLYTDPQGNVTDLREAYSSVGRQLSCASSVAYYHGNLLTGAPYGPPLLCQVTAL